MHLNNKVAVLDILNKRHYLFSRLGLFDLFFSQSCCGYGCYIHKFIHKPVLYVSSPLSFQAPWF